MFSLFGGLEKLPGRLLTKARNFIIDYRAIINLLLMSYIVYQLFPLVAAAVREDDAITSDVDTLTSVATALHNTMTASYILCLPTCNTLVQSPRNP